MADGKIVIETKLDADGINKGINSLRGQLNKLSSSLRDMLGKVSPAADDVAKDFDKVGQAISGMATSGSGIKSTVAGIEDMRATLDNLTASLDNTNAQIELQKQKLQDLQFSYKIASDIDPDSKRSTKLNEQILKTEARMISLTEKSDKTASKIWELDKAMERAANSTQSVEQNVESLDKGMAKASNSSKKLGKDMGTASTKTNAFGRNLARSGAQAAGLAAIINRSFKSVLKRLFVYNLILKGIRGIMQYTGGALKTNSQFVESLNIVKTNLMVAFQPIYDFILPAINALMRGLATATTYIATAVSSIFGKTYKESFNAAKNLDNAKKSMDDYGKSVKKTKGQLAGFDEINTLGSNDDSGASAPNSPAGFEMTMPDTTNIQNTVDKIKKTLKSLANSDFAKAMKSSLSKAFAEIKPQLEKIKQSYGRVWEDVKDKGKRFGDWLGGDFLKLQQSNIELAGKAIAGLLDSWDMVFNDIWNNVLSPFLDGIIDDLLPVFTQMGIEANKTFGVLFDNIKSGFDTMWKGVVRPSLELFKEIWLDLCEIIRAKWEEHGQPIFDKVRETIETVAGLWKALWDTVLKPVFDEIFTTLTALWQDHLKPLVDEIIEFAATFIKAALDIYNKFIAPIVKWLIGVLGPIVSSVLGTVVKVIGIAIGAVLDVVKGLLKALGGIIDFIAGIFTGDWERAWEGIKNIVGGIWDAIKGIFSGAWNAIKGIFSGVGDFFASVWQGIKNAFGGVADWFKNIFSKAWENVKNVFSVGGKIFSGLKDGIASVFKTVVNGIIGGINKVIALPFDKINGMLNTIRGVGFLGITPFKKLWNENPLPVPQIPKLASGAVIPPRAEFLAVLGDQRHGRNLEAPESLIRQIFKQEMSKFMAQNQPAYAGGGDTYVYIGNEQLDAYITRAVKRTQIKANGG